MARFLIVFPPYAESALHGPHLAGPLLLSVLRAAGYQSDFMDLNIDCIRQLLAPNFLYYIPDLIKGLPDVNEKFRINQCIRVLKERGTQVYSAAGTPAIRTLLSLVKTVFFPVPSSFEECLSSLKVSSYRQSPVSNIYESLVGKILQSNPSVIGFTVAFSEQLSEVIKLTKIIRDRSCTDTKIVIGGSQINLLPSQHIQKLKKLQLFDGIGLGNGEQIIQELFLRLARGQSTARCEVVQSSFMSQNELRNLPTPMFPKMDSYFKPWSFPVLVTKGCYWGRCSFCDYPRLSNLGKLRFMSRSVDQAFSEISFLRKEFPDCHINLISNAVPPSWYRKLFLMTIDSGLKLGTWSYMMHSPNLDEEFFRLAKSAGIRAINFGTESTNDRILKLMGKNANRSLIYKNIQDASQAGIKLVVNFIPDYPSTTFYEAMAMADDVTQLLPMIFSFNPQVFDLTDGTPLSDGTIKTLNDNKIYCRTRHGYHSIKQSLKSHMTKTQTRIIKRVFQDLKRQSLINNRLNRFGSQTPSSEAECVIDGSANIFQDEGGRSHLWIPSIDAEYQLSRFDESVLVDLLAMGGLVQFSIIQSLYTSKGGFPALFQSWWSAILKMGLVIEVRNSSYLATV